MAADVVFVTQSLPCFQGGHVLSQSIVPMDVAGERSHVLSRVFRVNKLHRVALHFLPVPVALAQEIEQRVQPQAPIALPAVLQLVLQQAPVRALLRVDGDEYAVGPARAPTAALPPSEIGSATRMGDKDWRC